MVTMIPNMGYYTNAVYWWMEIVYVGESEVMTLPDSWQVDVQPYEYQVYVEIYDAEMNRIIRTGRKYTFESGKAYEITIQAGSIYIFETEDGNGGNGNGGFHFTTKDMLLIGIGVGILVLAAFGKEQGIKR